jgi:hypothetical protein
LLVQWNSTELLVRNGTSCATKRRKNVFSLIRVKYRRVYASDRQCFLDWRKGVSSVLFIFVVKWLGATLWKLQKSNPVITTSVCVAPRI